MILFSTSPVSSARALTVTLAATGAKTGKPAAFNNAAVKGGVPPDTAKVIIAFATEAVNLPPPINALIIRGVAGSIVNIAVAAGVGA